MPKIKIEPAPHVTSIQENKADAFAVRLLQIINQYNASLDATHQVALSLVQFGQTVTLPIENIGFWNPSLIVFYGRNADGSPMQLVQHVTQISCLLTSVPRSDTTQPKQPIGFVRPESTSAGE